MVARNVLNLLVYIFNAVDRIFYVLLVTAVCRCCAESVCDIVWHPVACCLYISL